MIKYIEPKGVHTIHMEKIIIWCYGCGKMWFDRNIMDLYGTHARCSFCDGYTDGVVQ